jgi:hypothetical protein
LKAWNTKPIDVLRSRARLALGGLAVGVAEHLDLTAVGLVEAADDVEQVDLPEPD